MNRKKILFTYSYPSSFVVKDIQILRKHYKVSEYWFRSNRKIFLPFSLLNQLFFLLIFSYKIQIFISFGGYYSLLPVLFAKFCRKQSILLLGGTECVSFPEFGYGNFHKKLLGYFTKKSMQYARIIAPVHESLMYSENTYLGNVIRIQGARHFCKNIYAKIVTIYNGYNSSKWFNNAPDKVANSFITVAGLKVSSFYFIKGIDLILDAAEFFPESIFTIIGVPVRMKLPVKSKNVCILPAMPNAQLMDYYSKAQYYLQLSVSEGFPNAICEAMLCECIPVVSTVNGLPDIVGDTGYFLKKRDGRLLKELLRNILAQRDPDRGKKARERIINNFSEETRLKKLLEIIG